MSVRSPWMRCRDCSERMRRSDDEPLPPGEVIVHARMHLVDACHALGQRQALYARELACCGLVLLTQAGETPVSRDLQSQLTGFLQTIERQAETR